MKGLISIVVLLLSVNHATAASPQDCKLVEDRLKKYADLMDKLVFLDEEPIFSNQSLRQFYLINVTHEVIAGELERINEAQDSIKRLCQ
ncbi:hypothetical protein DXT90_00125 [Agrobacterium tumefaciens]|nr:hypothetical protein [Agrobacterium tumefaciens]